ncbi:MAG: peptidoglycan DD-metalloendopeptidase family protein [Candidatus Muirbacterium halophilum]|nr:peptidoglycan DD-metalloendopeptidase family protein [Candidatus Muirbacterium halophilum]MCK9474918.1 peptidoglycan DD-metalloendopeptidase family protein [Candidatus Muirbacterium halophilum]
MYKKVFILVLCFIILTPVYSISEDNAEELTELDRKRKKTEILLNSAKKKENELVSRLNMIKEEEIELSEEIDFVRESIRKFGLSIEENLKNKTILEEKIVEKSPALKNYIVYIYKRKNWDYSKIFFDSSSFNTFLKKYRIMKRIIKEELIFLDTVKTDLKTLEKTNNDINLQKEELMQFYDQLELQQNNLEKLKEEKEELLTKVKIEKRTLEEKYIDIERDYQRILSIVNIEIKKDDDKIKNTAISEKNSLYSDKPTDNTKLDFEWPLTEKRPVKLPYGQQYNEYNTIFNNQGIDIQVFEKDWIIASETGKVAYKGEMSGLGKILILKHTGDYTTVYTYLGDIFVRIGQSITKGEKLATGNLNVDNPEESLFHFEIRYKGEPVNPEKHIKN